MFTPKLKPSRHSALLDNRCRQPTAELGQAIANQKAHKDVAVSVAHAGAVFLRSLLLRLSALVADYCLRTWLFASSSQY